MAEISISPSFFSQSPPDKLKVGFLLKLKIKIYFLQTNFNYGRHSFSDNNNKHLIISLKKSRNYLDLKKMFVNVKVKIGQEKAWLSASLWIYNAKCKIHIFIVVVTKQLFIRIQYNRWSQFCGQWTNSGSHLRTGCLFSRRKFRI